jgi:hypothetical protein
MESTKDFKFLFGIHFILIVGGMHCSTSLRTSFQTMDVSSYCIVQSY